MAITTGMAVRRAVLGGVAALSVVAGSGLALMPRSVDAYTTSRVLYSLYFDDGSGQGQRLRQECVDSAARYGVQRAEAQVTPHARAKRVEQPSPHTVWQNRLDCIGHNDYPDYVRWRDPGLIDPVINPAVSPGIRVNQTLVR